jgi:hypothetical protein
MVQRMMKADRFRRVDRLSRRSSSHGFPKSTRARLIAKQSTARVHFAVVAALRHDNAASAN